MRAGEYDRVRAAARAAGHPHTMDDRRGYRAQLTAVALEQFALRMKSVTDLRRSEADPEQQQRSEWIQRCRTDLESWAIEALSPLNLRPAAHHRLLIEHLEKVLSGETTRLIVTMPPGSAKSTYASQLFPCYALQRRPRLRIIGASHTTGLAMDFSAKIQTFVTENSGVLTYGLRTENKERWYTTTGGAYLAAGVGTAIPGYRADLGILDDPVKSREAADSELDRKRVWEWYIGSFERRLTPGAPVILILTRWHEDDLAGRLLDVQPELWTVLNLPAEAEENDLLGRAPGEWLWEDDNYGYGAELAGIKSNLERAGATREWSSQYQQRPRPQEGSIFRVDRIGVLSSIPTGGKTVRAYDLAATRQTGTRDPDWTRGVKLTMLPNRRLVVENVVGCRGGPDEVERLIVNTASQDGKSIRVGLPQDPGQAGKAQVAYLTKSLQGYHVESSPESGDKVTRAGPIASQVNVGNVDIVEGPWNRSFLDELGAFPSGAKLDQVDALSRAYSMLLDMGSPLILSSRQLVASQRAAGRNRFGAATPRQRFSKVW